MNIWFNLWSGFDNNFNFISHGLLKNEKINITPDNPDILFYSFFGFDSRYSNCKKIFITGENLPPDPRADVSLTFYPDNKEKRNVRFPLYAYHYWNIINWWKLYPESRILETPEPKHNKFCNFIYRNSFIGVNGFGNYQDGVEYRIKLFHKLNKYKKVDSCGDCFNNTGFKVPSDNKIKFLEDYKFTIGIENSFTTGYVTEKLLDPFIAKSMPIYAGSELVNEDFSVSSFINCNNRSIDDVVEEIIYLDQNDDAYLAKFKNPCVNQEQLNKLNLETYKEKIWTLL